MAFLIDESLAAARKESGWILALGLALILLGAAAIVYEGVATLASIWALGVLMLAAGIVQLAAMFQARGAGHIILDLLIGLLDLFVGYVLITHPVAGALVVTLFLAVYLLFGGTFRVIYALWAQLPHYGYAVFSGLLAILLGVLIWIQWPSSALWFLGIAVGVNFLFSGFAWTRLAMILHRAGTRAAASP
jgi:uncharacterized membrane protein HdeD (DUF308 family)